MHGEHQIVIGRIQAEQQHPQQRADGEVERPGRLGIDPQPRLGLPGHIEDREFRLGIGQHLNGFALLLFEHGSQRIVPLRV